MGVTELIGGLIKPVTQLWSKRQDRKLAKVTAKAKLDQTSLEGDIQAKFTDQEWEVVSAGLQGSSWKDEYLTIIITSPFILIFIGGIAQAFGHPEILSGVGVGITALVAAGVNVGLLMEAVVLAGVGLSVWRKA